MIHSPFLTRPPRSPISLEGMGYRRHFLHVLEHLYNTVCHKDSCARRYATSPLVCFPLCVWSELGWLCSHPLAHRVPAGTRPNTVYYKVRRTERELTLK